jgi:chemotaxis protein MotA
LEVRGVGTVLVANPLHILKKIVGGIGGAFGGSKFSKARYIESLKMLYDLLNKARKEGLVALESDIEEPDKSPILSKYPAFLKDHHVRDFVCDTMRMAVTSGIEPFDVDQMMEVDMDVHHHGATQPIAALSTMADSLPGLGIVAAVLGVVITMGALGGPPEEIGHKVAAALVGTFLGILLCYGLVGPLAANMAKSADEEHAYYHTLRVSDAGISKGDLANHGGGDCEASNSRPRAAILPGGRASLPRWRSNGGGCFCVGAFECRVVRQSSSSRKRVVMMAIMGVRGRWPMLIS